MNTTLDSLLLNGIQLAYLTAASLFIVGLKQLGSPATARRGNGLAAVGMLVAIAATLLDRAIIDYTLIAVGILIGSAVGAVMAQKVEMTAMPQMVGLLNGLGGGASTLVAIAEFWRLLGTGAALPLGSVLTIILSVFIGGITLTGSLIAFAKLQELLSGVPIIFPLQRFVSIGLIGLFLVGSVLLVVEPNDPTIFWVLVAISLILGVLFAIPIGGADMPVAISLLNSFSGLAASAAGFVLANNMLIISGALVGASGIILTQIMCKAMNRSLPNVLFSAFSKAK
jgi:NAD(P) transhydrogenase subunit beta